MTNLSEAIRSFHADVYRLLFVVGIVGFSYFGFISVLLNLYLLRLGYGTGFIGLVNGSIAVAFAASSLPAGALGSRLGMRRTATIGMALVAAGVTLVPVAGSVLSGPYRDLGIIATRVLSGMGFALYMVNAYPYLVAATGARERTYAFALMTGLPPLAGFAGSLLSGAMPGWFAPLLGVDLTHPAPFAVALVFAGAVVLPAVPVLARAGDREPARRARSPGEPRGTAGGASRSDGAVGAFAVVVFLLAFTGLLRSAGEGAARSFFNVYLELDLAVSPSRIGLLLAVGQVAAAPAALVAPALTARAGKVPVIVVTGLLTAVGLVVLAAVPHWLAAGIGFTLVVGLRAVTQSVSSIMHMEIVPASRRSVTSGMIAMAMGLGFMSISFGGGYLIPAIGFPGFHLLAAAITAVGAVIFWLYFRLPRGEYRQNT
jgi:MFS family permease